MAEHSRDDWTDLTDFGGEDTISVRAPTRDASGEMGCPECAKWLWQMPQGETGGPVEIPTSIIAADTIRLNFQEDDVDTIETVGWRCDEHARTIVLPHLVDSPTAAAFDDAWVGLRVHLDDGRDQWVPVRLDAFPDPIAAVIVEVLER